MAQQLLYSSLAPFTQAYAKRLLSEVRCMDGSTVFAAPAVTWDRLSANIQWRISADCDEFMTRWQVALRQVIRVSSLDTNDAMEAAGRGFWVSRNRQALGFWEWSQEWSTPVPGLLKAWTLECFDYWSPSKLVQVGSRILLYSHPDLRYADVTEAYHARPKVLTAQDQARYLQIVEDRASLHTTGMLQFVDYLRPLQVAMTSWQGQRRSRPARAVPVGDEMAARRAIEAALSRQLSPNEAAEVQRALVAAARARVASVAPNRPRIVSPSRSLPSSRSDSPVPAVVPVIVTPELTVSTGRPRRHIIRKDADA